MEIHGCAAGPFISLPKPASAPVSQTHGVFLQNNRILQLTDLWGLSLRILRISSVKEAKAKI